MSEQWTENAAILTESIEQWLAAMAKCPEGCSKWVGFCDACADRMDHINAMRALLRLKAERDEARAEVERLAYQVEILRDERDGLAKQCAELLDENDRLDHENDAWLEISNNSEMIATQRLMKERDEARAEVERLQGEVSRIATDNDDLRALFHHLLNPPAWDANANGTIDNADELAAYAEQAGHEGDE